MGEEIMAEFFNQMKKMNPYILECQQTRQIDRQIDR